MNAYMHEPSEYRTICFTAKINLGNPDSVNETDYAPLLEHWEQYAIVKQPYYEKDKTGRCHMHGILTVKKGFYKRRLQLKGFYVYTTDCVHLEQWMNYCKKVDPDNMLIIKLRQERKNIENTNYMF